MAAGRRNSCIVVDTCLTASDGVWCQAKFGERAVNEDDRFTQFDYTLEQVTHSGVCGRNATGATPEDGEMILSRAAEVVAEMVEQMLVEEIPIPVARDAGVKTGYRPPPAG